MKLLNTFTLSKIFLAASLVSLPLASEALTYALPKGDDTVIGQTTTVESKPGDTLRLLCRRYDVGFQEMQSANPSILSDQRLLPGTKIVIPTQFVLPPKPWKGLMVNLSAYRLFYFPEDMPVVITFPIGIGKEGLDYQNQAWDTPTFNGYIVRKAKDPSWRPPMSVRVSTQETLGIKLPSVIGPEQKNPLGGYALYTSKPGYLMHGTNRPYGVGDQVSSGCLRVLPEDIEQLYYTVPDKTPISVFRQPVDLGVLNNQLYLEMHPKQKGITQDDLPQSDTSITSTILLYAGSNNINVNWDTVYQLLYHSNVRSIPVDISLKPLDVNLKKE